jgi:hypothetical protein
VANSSNQYSEPVSVEVTGTERVLSVGKPFSELWDAHPDDDPCDVQGLAGQCAVKMAVMFDKAGVSLAGLTGKRCWGQGEGHKLHFLDPNDVGRWLAGKGSPYSWASSAVSPEPMPGIAARAFVGGKTGVLLFLDFWNEGKSAPVLDHMDVWNQTQMGHGAETYFLRSREIQFWRIN